MEEQPTGISKWIRHLRHPLVLVGFCLFLFFGLLREFLSSDKLSTVVAEESAIILNKLIDYAFVLALITIPLGFILSLYNQKKNMKYKP